MSKNDEKPKRKKPKILTKYEQFVVSRLRDVPVWVREGLTDDEIAKRLNIHIWTLGDYRRKHPKFAEALERPTMWETHVYPRLAEIQQWFQEGVNAEDIIKNLGIGKTTWYEYIDKHPMLAELVKWSKSVTISRVETSLLKAATGYDVEELKTVVEEDKNGKKKTRIEKTKRHIPANPTAMIFYLKNRAPSEWNDRREIIIDTKAAELERKQLFLDMNAQRTLPINKDVRKALTRYLEIRLETESEYLFIGQRGAFERNAVNLILNKYGDRVSVKVTPHMLRHTLGYRLVQSTPLTTIQQILGHDHVSTTNIYTLTTEKDMAIISATEIIALPFLDMIKDELETNTMLIEDFGIRKGSRWNNNEIWLRSKSGLDSCIMIRGIDGSLRGIHYKHHRPTLVLLDDLLKDDTAKSETKRDQIKSTFTDVVLPIGTRDTNILICGIILNEEDIMADLLKGKIPGVRSIRKAAVIQFSDRDDLWSEWEQHYNNLQDEDRINTALSFFIAIKMKCLRVRKYCGMNISITTI